MDRGLKLFDEIVVLVVKNSAKKSFMTAEERVEFIESVYLNDLRVKVLASDGLTVDVAKEVGASCILRGVRMIQDFEYEKNLAEVYRDMAGIDTVLLYTLPQHGHISSSIVREMISYGVDASAYLPIKGDKDMIPKKIK